MNLDIKVNNIRNIKTAEISLPLDKGLYALVGPNGCGKSTLMLIMSLIVKTSSAHMLSPADISEDSVIDIETEDGKDHWIYKSGKMTTGKYKHVKATGTAKKAHSVLVVSTHWPGFYEGSIFYGCRFDDYDSVDSFLGNPGFDNNLVDADKFVAETLGYILHNDKSHYQSLKRIRNRTTAEKYGFKGIPYFIEYNGHIVSQFKMSSGECLLISLIDFINNLVIKGNRFNKFLFLIDEVELALHPSAIDRLIQFLNDLMRDSDNELVIYFSTHSAELLQRLSARNIFLVENEEGNMNIINPCYPNYAIRSLYIPNGFDFILLVEDEMTKAIVDKVIRTNRLGTSKLICVLPAGGCSQMLKLHHDMLTYNAMGVGKQIISIYDGDVKDQISKKAEYSTLKKCFLPIPSVEKYLKMKFVNAPDKAFIKYIGDKYFTQRALPDIIFDYMHDDRTKNGKDGDGKALYSVIASNALKAGLSEKEFIKFLADDIYEYENPQKFTETLIQLLT